MHEIRIKHKIRDDETSELQQRPFAIDSLHILAKDDDVSALFKGETSEVDHTHTHKNEMERVKRLFLNKGGREG